MIPGASPKKVAETSAGGMGKHQLARGIVQHGQNKFAHATPNGMHPMIPQRPPGTQILNPMSLIPRASSEDRNRSSGWRPCGRI